MKKLLLLIAAATLTPALCWGMKKDPRTGHIGTRTSSAHVDPSFIQAYEERTQVMKDDLALKTKQDKPNAGPPEKYIAAYKERTQLMRDEFEWKKEQDTEIDELDIEIDELKALNLKILEDVRPGMSCESCCIVTTILVPCGIVAIYLAYKWLASEAKTCTGVWCP